jgi:hypothetical protein
MRSTFALKLAAVIAIGLVTATAGGAGFEMTPAIQAELDRQKGVVASWAANPVVLGAVVAQNRRGPIAGMDNAKWKMIRRSDPVVTAFQSGAAGQFLKTKLQESNGAVSEAFLNGAKGEKVAFVEKTTSYLHRGASKFDSPFTSGKAWQGPAEFDESSQTYAVQIAVPVLEDGKAVGVLVVGVNLSYLEKVVRK